MTIQDDHALEKLKTEKSNIVSSIIAIIVLVGIIIFSAWLFVYFTNYFKGNKKCDNSHVDLCTDKDTCEQQKFFWWDNSCHLAEKPQPLASEYPDFDSLNDMKSLELVNDFQTYTPNSVPDFKFNKYGSFTQEGEISKGYIEIIASIDNKPLTKWESIFLRINYNSGYFNLNGGHIFRSLSLKLPPSDKTHLLYALNDIPFLESKPYDETRVPGHSNWFRYFKDGNKNDFMTFISSLTPAKIDLIKIYYKCQVSSDCSLTLSK